MTAKCPKNGLIGGKIWRTIQGELFVSNVQWWVPGQSVRHRFTWLPLRGSQVRGKREEGRSGWGENWISQQVIALLAKKVRMKSEKVPRPIGRGRGYPGAISQEKQESLRGESLRNSPGGRIDFEPFLSGHVPDKNTLPSCLGRRHQWLTSLVRGDLRHSRQRLCRFRDAAPLAGKEGAKPPL